MLWAPQRLAEYAFTNPKIAPNSCHGPRDDSFRRLLASVKNACDGWKDFLLCTRRPGFSLVHASPDDLWRAPLANAKRRRITEYLRVAAAPIVVYGHIHCPYIRRLHAMTVGNTGSVSQSYDGDTRASYLVIDGESIAIRRSSMMWRVKQRNSCVRG